jgi:hypothetical protein
VNDSVPCASHLPLTNFTLLSFSSTTQRQCCRGTCRLESALAFAAVLIAEDPKLSFPIPAQSVRTKQPMPFLVHGFDRLFVRHRSPDQPIDLLHGLDRRLHDTHVNLHLTTSAGYLQPSQPFMTQ